MLKCNDLVVQFGESKVLNGVAFKVNAGETVGIIGPNGSGKTTLFNCICGFNFPVSGSILFKEQDVTNAPPFERAIKGLGRVFQNFGVFREMTVEENLITALESRRSFWQTLFPWGKALKAHRIKANELLAGIGLESKSCHKAGSLSGGQLRLLEIARTLAFGADLFLLDEPTAGVSPIMKSQVAALISKLKEAGKTILIIEHDLNFIEAFCDRIVVLDSGRVVLDGSLLEVRKSPLLQEIYFGKKA